MNFFPPSWRRSSAGPRRGAALSSSVVAACEAQRPSLSCCLSFELGMFSLSFEYLCPCLSLLAVDK